MTWKAWKIILLTGLATGLLCIGLVAFYVGQKPHSPLPVTYEYHFSKEFKQKLNDQYSDAQILFVGDRMSLNLIPYMESFRLYLSQKLNAPLRIKFMANNHSSLGRLLAQLKQLKKVPPVIVFHGGSQEFDEIRFDANDYEVILENFSRYQKPKVAALTHFLPALAPFVYRQTKTYHLTEKVDPRENFVINSLTTKEWELQYKFFELELRDFLKWSNKVGTKLILINGPINLLQIPRAACLGAESLELEKVIASAEESFNRQDFKSAIEHLQKNRALGEAHPLYHYLLGKIFRNMENYPKAYDSFILAATLDCIPWRTNQVFNSIIQRLADQYGLTFIDFHQLVSVDLKNDLAFADEIFPTLSYYQNLLSILALEIKKELHL